MLYAFREHFLWKGFGRKFMVCIDHFPLYDAWHLRPHLQLFSNVFFSWNMKFTGTYNRFNNYLLCITLKGRGEILINKGWLGVGMVGEDTFPAPSPIPTLHLPTPPPPPRLPPSSDSFICSVDSTYTVGNHGIWMIGFTEFRAGIRTKKKVNRLITLFLIPNRFS